MDEFPYVIYVINISDERWKKYENDSRFTRWFGCNGKEDLTFDFIEMGAILKPKVIVCENVKGLTMNHARDYFNEMVKGFESIGYTVGHKVMRAAHYGVPQKRERIFFFCIRDDIADKLGINFMTVQSLFPEQRRPVPTLKDAILDLQENEENKKDAEFLKEDIKRRAK